MAVNPEAIVDVNRYDPLLVSNSVRIDRIILREYRNNQESESNHLEINTGLFVLYYTLIPMNSGKSMSFP